MILSCPYCKRPMTDEMSGPKLSQRKMRIYNAVLTAGVDGIAPDDLLVRMYAEDEWPTPAGSGILRTQIFEINTSLRDFGQKIIARPRRRYRLVSIEGIKNEDEEPTEAQPEADN